MHHSPTRRDRERLLRQRSLIVWLYGLSGAGKSTLASRLASDLHGRGLLTSTLDGDALRGGLNRGLGFTAEGRTENIRRAAETASLIAETGAIVICSFITPLNSHRRLVWNTLGHLPLLDVYVRCPFSVCAARDVKGLYQSPPPNFTGRDSLFEEPDPAPSLTIDSNLVTVDDAARYLLAGVTSHIAL